MRWFDLKPFIFVCEHMSFGDGTAAGDTASRGGRGWKYDDGSRYGGGGNGDTTAAADAAEWQK